VGTASLVFGLILIGFGLFFSLWMFVEMIQGGGQVEFVYYGLGFLIFAVPIFVVGGLFLRKFDKDRKKEKSG